MSGYKTFAVVGAGTLGRFIVEEFIKKRDAGDITSITVLTRSSDSHKDLAERGAKIVAVDYDTPSSLESALTGIDVLISALGLHGIGHQDALAASAKAAGVKLFVPSDFGTEPQEQFENPIFKQKEAIKQKLKELDLPYAVYYTGLFTEKVLVAHYAAALGVNFATGEFSIPGSGTAPASWTKTEDVAQFVAYSLTALPREKIERRIFRIEADRVSLNDLATLWEKHTDKRITVSHRPRSDFEKAVEKNPMDFVALFVLAWDSGYMTVGSPEDLANTEYPEWKPKKVIDVLTELYKN